MKKYLFLDDVRSPDWVYNTFNGYFSDDELYFKNVNWEVVKDYDEFVKWMEEYTKGMDKTKPIFLDDLMISFDHDLGYGKDGYDAVKWLSENNFVVKEYYVHSANPTGKANIIQFQKNWLNFNGL